MSLDGLAPLAAGWDNALWVTGEGIAFRFPRRAIAVPGVEREIAVLPLLAPRLPLPIPVPTLIGRPAEGYPWPFFGARLLPGREIADAPLDGDREAFGGGARRVPARAPRAGGRRGARIRAGARPDRPGRHDPPRAPDAGAVRDPGVARAVDRAAGRLRAPRRGRALPATTDEALVHGDLHVRHVLVGPDGRPSAVIDWGDLAVADPSVDLSLYWSQLDGPARDAFRDAYGAERLTPARLLRARVLALFLDAALAAYAHDTGNDALLRTTLDGLERTLRD